MGIVYKARQPDLDRLVALKELHGVHAAAPELVQRFVRESRLTGSLNHPNIVTVHDYVEERGTSYIAMEYMPRGSLRSWVGDVSLAQLAGVLEGLLAGLAAVEPSGIVHRDLKPENVLISADGRVKITDFGIAKATQSASVASFMTATGITVGTPAYMAPEQALAQEIGPWTDLYSVGVMTYEHLVGRLPFADSPTPVAILMRHVNESIPPVTDSRPDLDPSLSEWVARLLVKEPSGRTPSAAQAWEELEEVVIELLGARWRRDARLHERGSPASSPAPLTPAPFDSQSVKAPGPPPMSPLSGSASSKASAQPETESGFLSYGRAPTAVERSQPPAVSEGSSEGSSESPPTSALPKDLSQGPPESPGKLLSIRARGTRMAAVAVLTAFAGALGFGLVPSGESAQTSAQKAGASPAAPHGPNTSYAVALSDEMSKLNGVRASLGAHLSHARTAQGEATTAQQLAQAQSQAAEAVRKLVTRQPERTANATIATALIEMGRGYSTMAGAARREDRRGFDNGRKAVTSATAALAAAFAQLHKLGYRLGG
jgi:serine/threonine protein kinase